MPGMIYHPAHDMGQELQLSLHYMKLCYLDERELNKSLGQFRFNVYQGVFNKLKQNYQRVFNFKANRAIKMAETVISGWR